MGAPSNMAAADKLFAEQWADAKARGLTTRAYADELGISESALLGRRKRIEQRLGRALPAFSARNHGNNTLAERLQPQFEAQQPQDDAPTFDEILAQRLKSTSKKIAAKDASELLDVKLKVSGPFGLAFIGDPHLDNPGCNLALLMEHTRIIMECPRMFAFCVGDIQDNWIGRLARLWAGMGISAHESQILADGWLSMLGPKLVALSNGNHDVWAQGYSGSGPLDWIKSKFGTIGRNHGARLRIANSEGECVSVNMRHDFPGRSQYNAAHGPMKSMLFGFRDDVAVAGHTHEFGALDTLNPTTRRGMHAIRLGSYKHADEYAEQIGALDKNLTECSVLIVDPMTPDRRHKTFRMDSPARAAEVLNMLGSEWEKRNPERKKPNLRTR